MTSGDQVYDVVIIGAGPAGLSAAALLARCKRDVVVIGERERANSVAEAVHNVPLWEGMPPEALYSAMEEQLSARGVQVLAKYVDRVETNEQAGLVSARGEWGSVTAKRLLLATGLDYQPPSWVPAGTWGRAVFSCPFCHASEHSGEAFAVVGPGPHAVEIALLAQAHAACITVLTDDNASHGPAADRLRELGGEVVVDTVVDAESLTSGGVRLKTEGGRIVEAGAVLVAGVMRARRALTEMVGLQPSPTGLPEVDSDGRTANPLVWLAGNAAKPQYMVVESMGTGIRAGVSLHRDLTIPSV